MSQGVTFTRHSALRLCAALCAELGSRSGSRVLIVKGLAAEAMNLRDPRCYADVDVLCEPASMDAVRALIVAAGWRQRPASRIYQATVTHAITFTHPDWPCDIDLHCRFPGFMRDPEEVFDLLWAGRRPLDVCGIVAQSAGLEELLLIEALHALRTYSPRHHENWRLQRAIRAARDPAVGVELGRLARVAEATGASESAAVFLAAVGAGRRDAPRRSYRPFAALPQWETVVKSGGSPLAVDVAHVLALRGVPRIRALGMFLWPSHSDFVLDHPQFHDASRLTTVIRRIGRIAWASLRLVFVAWLSARRPPLPHSVRRR